jgi:hypothetical protein
MINLEFVLEIAAQEKAYKPVGFDNNENGYDEAIIGISNDFRLIYSIEKMIHLTSIQGEMSLEDAQDWLSFNTFSSGGVESMPIYANTYEYID